MILILKMKELRAPEIVTSSGAQLVLEFCPVRIGQRKFEGFLLLHLKYSFTVLK